MADFPFIQVHSGISAPPNNNQSLSISREWLIRSSKSTFKSHVYKFDLALIQARVGEVNSGKMSSAAFFQ